MSIMFDRCQGVIIVAVAVAAVIGKTPETARSEEHTSELQSRPHISYAVFCLKKKKKQHNIKLNKNILTILILHI